jgi:hypothetical protein
LKAPGDKLSRALRRTDQRVQKDLSFQHIDSSLEVHTIESLPLQILPQLYQLQHPGHWQDIDIGHIPPALVGGKESFHFFVEIQNRLEGFLFVVSLVSAEVRGNPEDVAQRTGDLLSGSTYFVMVEEFILIPHRVL